MVIAVLAKMGIPSYRHTQRLGAPRLRHGSGVALFVGLALASTANASTVTSSSIGLDYRASTGEANQASVERLSSGNYRVSDPGATIMPSYPCLLTGVNEATCPYTPQASVVAEDGNDTVAIAGAARASINAGAGDDRASVAGDVQGAIAGGDGADELTGGSDSDDLQGAGGNDELHGLGGADTLEGGEGADSLDSSAGEDTLRGGSGEDDLNGGPDRDTLYGEDGADVLAGADGDDRLVGGPGADDLNGAAGLDLAGYDTSAPLTVVEDGEAGDGPAGENDNVHSDVESIHGGDGNDILIGGSGNNIFLGGGGDDQLVGGAGDDTIGGDEGDDVIDGAEGADLLLGGAGDDDIAGGPGLDRTSYLTTTAITASLDGEPGDGADGESDNLRPDIEWLEGGLGDDRLIGNDGANTISSGPGNDTIDGRAGYDVMLAQGGNDTIDARDAGADRVECAGGLETVYADAVDWLRGPCDVVERVQETSEPERSDQGLDDGGQDGFSDAVPSDDQRVRHARLPRLSISRRTVRVSATGIAPIRVRCESSSLGRCSGELSLAADREGTRSTRNSARQQSRALALGRRSFSARAGQATVVKVPLSRRGRGLLRRLGPVRVSVAAYVVGDPLSAVFTRTVTLRRMTRSR